MILVEIVVPSTDGAYEFKLNEDVPVGILLEEIGAVVSEKEQCALSAQKESLILFHYQKKTALSPNLTLYENGITTGDRLVLL
ncbi:EsaB/YukD family protein [Ruminococcus sp.]|uniref:EsaB/YukD family protein n=1 Tax=Ruminococcus sp. TaxID=41978 RepID=UPI00388D4AF0